MSRTLYKPNIAAIRKEAEKAKRSGSGKFDFYEWVLGDNILRFMPPYNAKGLIAKCRYTHFELPPHKDIASCLKEWPETFDVCPVCSKLEVVKKKMPNVDLGRQTSKEQYVTQVVNREDENAGVQLCRITPAVHTWLAAQIDNPRIGDITDPDDGFDVIITKTEKRRRGGNSIRYSCSFVPKSCALHDDSKMVDLWLDQMQDLDKLFSPPSDEYIADITSIASGMVTYYLRAHRDDVTTDPPEDSPPTRERRTLGNETKERRSINEPKKRETVETKKEPTPSDVPDCHANLDNPAKHKNGNTGFDETLEKCLACPDDLSCASAKQEKGV